VVVQRITRVNKECLVNLAGSAKREERHEHGSSVSGVQGGGEFQPGSDHGDTVAVPAPQQGKGCGHNGSNGDRKVKACHRPCHALPTSGDSQLRQNASVRRSRHHHQQSHRRGVPGGPTSSPRHGPTPHGFHCQRLLPPRHPRRRLHFET